MTGNTVNYAFTFPTYGDTVSNTWSSLSTQFDTALTTVDAIRKRLFKRPGFSIAGPSPTLVANTSLNIPFNTTTLASSFVNPSSWHSNVTNLDQFVSPESGLYALNCYCLFNNTATTQVFTTITVNGTRKFGASEGLNAASGGPFYLQMHGCLVLAVNDIVRMTAQSSTAQIVTPRITLWKISDL
jgi:hypothetical protein